MSRHSATIYFTNADPDAFRRGRYSRAHEWRFDGGTVVPASANPGIVPPPLADAAAVDPEEAFLASIASCHMMWFLDYARRGGYAVATYEDAAEAALEECDDRRYRITKVTLHPRIDWAGDGPDAEALAELHHKAHDSCFIANSITAEVVVEPA